jgi:hypothetical protein
MQRWAGSGAGDGATFVSASDRRKCPARRGEDWSFARQSPLVAFVVAFSLIVQLFAAATPPSVAAPAFVGADDAAIAAELKGVFGGAAGLCAHINDRSAPIKHTPFGYCCDQCPLCRFAAQAVAFAPPDAPALPERLDSDAHGIRAPPGLNALPAYRAQPNRARAPPLAV